MNKLIHAIMVDNLTAASQVFETAIQEKVTDALEAKKFELAQSIDEKKKLDPVDHDELDGDHDDREDKDIDNDGDVDSSDEYLHNRRKTVKKAVKNNEEVEEMDEAVTTTLKFKKDLAGATAIGKETGRTGLLQSGKKVKPGEYKLTFKNDRDMMKFMDKYSSQVAEGIETQIAKEKEQIARSNEKIKSMQDREDRKKKAMGDKK